VLLALVAFCAAVPVPTKNCGSAADLIKIDFADASAWPVQRGKEEKLSIRLLISEPISDGTYQLKLTFNGLPLIDKSGKLHELGLPLPIPKGPYLHNMTINVPGFIPAGTAAAHLVIKNQAGKAAICVQVDVPFKVETESPSEVMNALFVPEAVKPYEVGVPIPVKNCGKATDIFKVTQADASIWPPKVGFPLTLKLNGTLTSDITGGRYEAKVKLGGIQIIDQKGTIQDLVKLFNLTLPIHAGNYGTVQSFTIPAVVPKIPLELWAQGFNQNGTEIVCLDVNVPLQ